MAPVTKLSTRFESWSSPNNNSPCKCSITSRMVGLFKLTSSGITASMISVGSCAFNWSRTSCTHSGETLFTMIDNTSNSLSLKLWKTVNEVVINCAVVLFCPVITMITGALKFLAIVALVSNSNAIPSPEKSLPSITVKSYLSSSRLNFSMMVSIISPVLFVCNRLSACDRVKAYISV